MTIDDTPGTPPSPPPATPPPPPPPASPTAEPPPPPMTAGGPPPGDRVDVGGYLRQGWQLFAENPALLGGGFAIVFVILLLSSVTVIGPLLLAGPLMAGYYGIVQKLRDGQQEPEFGELFAGFSDFARTCVAGLLVLLVFILGAAVDFAVGLVLGGIPCLGQIVSFVLSLAVSVVTAGATIFVLPTVAVSSRSATDALGDNIRFLQAHLTPALLLGLVHIGLSLLGSALCIVGLLVTIPVASGFVMAAYDDFYRPRVQG